jgi:SseB protein C-terminal domain
MPMSRFDGSGNRWPRACGAVFLLISSWIAAGSVEGCSRSDEAPTASPKPPETLDEAPTVSPKPPEVHAVPNTRFLGEQIGPTETLLTAKLTEIFASGGLVLRAYLVRVSMGPDPSALNVLLAVRTKAGGMEPSLFPPINAAFASLFGPKQHLDILFVREDTEKAIQAVCKPFYSAADAGAPPPP